MPVKNIMSLLNSYKCEAYQLVDQSKLAQNAFSELLFCKNVLGETPQTPILCLLIVFHTMPFAVTLHYLKTWFTISLFSGTIPLVIS